MKQAREGSCDHWIFESTGRQVSWNFGIVGISVDGLASYGGYDWESYEAASLMPEERNELADHMIARWTAFKNYTDEGERGQA